MIGLETHYAWALLSLVSAGIFSFILKIGAERTHSSALLNSISCLVASGISLVMFFVFGGTYSIFTLVLGTISGFLYIYGGIARSDALTYIDSALYFPLYKIIGPLVVLVAGLFYFGEHITWVQAVGFVGIIGVPLLLIDHVESSRQKDLRKGIWLTLISAVLISTGALFGKEAMSVGSTLFVFLIINYLVSGVGQLMIHVSRIRNPSKSKYKEVFLIAIILGIFQFLGFMSLLVAYQTGEVAIVFAINSTYIVIPIILSIWFYREHWNTPPWRMCFDQVVVERN